jgi:hypothetical protein
LRPKARHPRLCGRRRCGYPTQPLGGPAAGVGRPTAPPPRHARRQERPRRHYRPVSAPPPRPPSPPAASGACVSVLERVGTLSVGCSRLLERSCQPENPSLRSIQYLNRERLSSHETHEIDPRSSRDRGRRYDHAAGARGRPTAGTWHASGPGCSICRARAEWASRRRPGARARSGPGRPPCPRPRLRAAYLLRGVPE